MQPKCLTDSVYSQESEELTLPCQNGSGQLPTAKSSGTQQPSCSVECLMDLYLQLQSSPMSQNLQDEFCRVSTLSQEEAPARTSVLQDFQKVWTESEAAFSMNSSGLLEKSSQSTFFGKMSAEVSENSTKSMQSLKSLATPQEQAALKLHTLEDVTGVKEYGFLPTITASESKATSRKRYVNSKETKRKSRMAAGLRRCQDDPCYLHPSFAEEAMMYPLGWTELKPLAIPFVRCKPGKLLKD